MQVLLARQMEQSAKDFAAWRKVREREVQQLRRAGRKQAAHVQKLEALQAKQSAVLRRKTEEAEAARRRLKVHLSPKFMLTDCPARWLPATAQVLKAEHATLAKGGWRTRNYCMCSERCEQS